MIIIINLIEVLILFQIISKSAVDKIWMRAIITKLTSQHTRS
jgi:hypothetical protein